MDTIDLFKYVTEEFSYKNYDQQVDLAFFVKTEEMARHIFDEVTSQLDFANEWKPRNISLVSKTVKMYFAVGKEITIHYDAPEPKHTKIIFYETKEEALAAGGPEDELYHSEEFGWHYKH